MRLGFEAGFKEASKRPQTCRNVLLGSVEAWFAAGLNKASKKLQFGFIFKQLKPASRRSQRGLKLAETFY